MISDPRKFIRLWLTKNSVTIDERGTLKSADQRDNLQILDTIILDYNEQIASFNYKADKKLKAASDTHLQKALDELIGLHATEEKKKILARVKFSGAPSLSQLEQFVLAMTGKTESHTTGVFAHFLWSIKRRLNNEDVLFNIMPIVLGKQGAGKSYALEKLLNPIANLTLEINLNDAVDPRFFHSFSKNYAIVINEMAGAQKTDVEKLKNLITAKNNDVRKLHTSQVTKVKQNTALIGTTNKPVAEIIYDPSGARRFYEIKSLDKMNWDLINSIDYIALWTGIDETRPRGYYEEHAPAIVKEQEKLIGREELQVFLELKNVKPGTKEIAAAVLYDEYKVWCENNGVKNPFNSVWFGRRLIGKGFEAPHQKRIRGKNTLMYLINEDSEMHEKASFDPLQVKEWI